MTFLLAVFTTSDLLPKHILRQIEEEREAEKKEQERLEWERNLCKVSQLNFMAWPLSLCSL